MIRLIAFTLISVSSAASFANDTSCLSTRAREVLSQYELKSWHGPKADPDLSTPLNFCDTNSLERKTLDALVFMEDLKYLNFVPDEFDQGIMGASPAEFFKQRIRKIWFDSPELTSCTPLTIAYYNKGPTPDSIHMCAYANNYSTMQTASVLVHEARHSEGHGHQFCEQGYMLRLLGCDQRYSDGGSYAVGVEFSVKVSRSEGVAPAIRQEARGNAAADLINRFNEYPLDMKMGLPLLAQDDSIDFFDGDSIQPMAKRPEHSQIIWAQRDVPVQFDLLKGELTRQIPGFAPSANGGSFSKFFKQLPLEKRLQILDVHYGDIACFLYETSIFCDYQGARAEVPLPFGMRAERFLSLHTTIADIFYIRTKDGENYAVKVSDPNTWVPEDFSKGDAFLKGYVGFGSLEKKRDIKRYSISIDGVLQIQNPARNPPWFPVEAGAGKSYKNILRPMLWSDKLKEL